MIKIPGVIARHCRRTISGVSASNLQAVHLPSHVRLGHGPMESRLDGVHAAGCVIQVAHDSLLITYVTSPRASRGIPLCECRQHPHILLDNAVRYRLHGTVDSTCANQPITGLELQ